MLSGSGEALESTERRRRSPVLEVEDDGDCGDATRPWSRGSSERSETSKRSVWAPSEGEAVAVGATTASGGESSARAR